MDDTPMNADHQLRPLEAAAKSLLLVLLFSAALPLTLRGQETETDQTPPPPSQTEPAETQPVPTTEEPSTEPVDQTPPPNPEPTAPAVNPSVTPEPKKETDKPVGPCTVPSPRNEELIDQYRRELFETVCEAAAKFDGFFGNRRFDEEARRTNGRVAVGIIWDEHEGTEFDGRAKIDINFPNFDRRIRAFLGRDDRDDFVQNRDDNLDFLPTFFEREGDEEWLVGFGYRPVRGDRDSVDFDGGIEINSEVDPFVRARYRHYRVFGNENLFRARQIVYWTKTKDTGSASRLDLERPFGERTLARWTGNVIFDGETEGADWDAGITLFHGFTPNRAVSWFVGVDGETKREVPIEDYGTTVTYRQRMLREWFFGQIITGVTWPRESLADQREMAFHVGFGIEIHFSGEDLGLGRRTAPPAAAPADLATGP
jgi:hypothetical protein